jgi:DNA repair exonuclease SbcCD ATPase subunit
VKVDVNFWREVDGIIQSLNGEQRRDTNKIIEKYLGKFEDFILTTLSLQGNNALFIDKSQSERKEVLSQLLGVDVFDKLYQIASDDNKETSTLIRKFTKDDFPVKLVEIESGISQFKSKMEIVTSEVTELRESQNRLNDEVMNLKSKIADTGSFDYNIEDLESELKRNISELDIISSDILISTDRKENMDKLDGDIRKLMGEYVINDIDLNVLEHRNLSDNLKDIKNSIEKLDIKKHSLVDKKLHLDSHKYNPECNVCIENSTFIISSKKTVEDELISLDNSISELMKNRDAIELRIQELIPYTKRKAEYTELETKLNKVDKDIYSLKSQISSLETKRVTLKSRIEKTEVLVDEYYRNEEQIKLNKSIQSQLKTKDSEIKSLIQKISLKNSELMEVFKKHTTLESQRDTILERIDEVKLLEEKNKLYEYYLNSLNKDGVSLELIEKSIPMIEGEINNILSQIVDFGMELELEGKNINSNLVYGDQKWPLELCSGMERFISGLAIRIALINVCSLPRPNFLVIDEGFGTLDSENLTSLYMLFSYLKTQFDFVMIISHIDSMRDVVDVLLEIKKTDGFSSVKF